MWQGTGLPAPSQGLLLCPQLCGVALLAVGIWVSVDGPSFLEIFGPLSSSAMQFVNVGYFLIAAGAVLFALGFLGCYGAHTENKCALMMVCPTSPLASDTRPWGSPDPHLDPKGLSEGAPASFLGGGGGVRARNS